MRSSLPGCFSFPGGGFIHAHPALVPQRLRTAIFFFKGPGSRHSFTGFLESSPRHVLVPFSHRLLQSPSVVAARRPRLCVQEFSKCTRLHCQWQIACFRLSESSHYPTTVTVLGALRSGMSLASAAAHDKVHSKAAPQPLLACTA